MTWVKLDDNFVDHPKVTKLSDGAFRMHLAGISHASRNLTDGRLDRHIPRRLTSSRRPGQLVRELVESGLWDETENGYEIHDYLDFQPSRAEVIERRQRDAERKRRARSSTPESERTSERTSEGSHSGSPRAPSRPVPKHSVSSSIEPQGSPAVDDDDRIEPLALRLGRADHEAANADGIAIRNPAKHLAACIENRRAEVATVAATMRNATAADLAAMFEPKPDRANPHVPTWEETQARQAAEAAETNLSAEERAAAVAAVKAAATKLKEHR